MNPEANKNSNNPEVIPANNDVDASPPIAVYTPVNLPVGGSSLAQVQPRRFNVKKTVLWILAIVLITPVAFVAIIIILLIAQSSLKMNKLNNHAKGLAKELSSLVFVEGQSINAKGFVDGDFLTANDDPTKSTFAHGSLDVNNSLASLASEVSTNLGNSGFTREGSTEAPYYATNMSGVTYDRITFRYIKGDEAIRVIYMLDKAYTCPKVYICMHTPERKTFDNIYPVNGFDTVTVIKMKINLSDKSDDYHSGYFL